MITIAEKTIPHRDPKPEKVEQVATISDLLDRSSGLFLTDYRGFTVAEKSDLTRRLRAANAEYHVVKNTLFKRAYGERGENADDLLSGPTAVAFALGDPVAPAKIVLDFLREKRKGEIKGAVIDGKVIGVDAVKTLSELPPKEVLLGQVVGTIQGPINGFVWGIQDLLAGFVRVVQAVHDQKAGA